MEEKRLLEMELRSRGDFTLKSGARSEVFWDIEKMSQYPQWVRIEAIREWIYRIGLYRPNNLVGIPVGGLMLARDIGSIVALNTYITDRHTTTVGLQRRTIVVEDVMTTGNTIKRYLSDETVAIAVLVNRSGLSELSSIPIVTGIFADRV